MIPRMKFQDIFDYTKQLLESRELRNENVTIRRIYDIASFKSLELEFSNGKRIIFFGVKDICTRISCRDNYIYTSYTDMSQSKLQITNEDCIDMTFHRCNPYLLDDRGGYIYVKIISPSSVFVQDTDTII